MFTGNSRVKIIFGESLLSALGQEVYARGLTRGVLIADNMFCQDGFAQEIKEATPAISNIFSATLPTLADAERAAEAIRSTGANFVVALGGGSCIDLAKFATALSQSDGTATGHFFEGKPFELSLPLFAAPTTAGTGSEVTGVAVMTAENGTKAPVCAEVFYPAVAIVDPALTLSVPPRITAATGLDAMAHALEAYWCRAHNDASDTLAITALENIFEGLERAYFYGDDLDARTKMSFGSVNAGLAFAPTRTAAVHACSYPLSEDYKLSHGEACAATLPEITLLNSRYEPRRMELLSARLGFSSVFAMADEIARLRRVTGLRSTAELDISNYDGLARKCLAHPLMNNNPEIPSQEELVNLLKGSPMA